jgi:hypothetical protein
MLDLLVLYDCHCKQGLVPWNSVNELLFVMVMGCVLFEVRTKFLNIVQASCYIKRLNTEFATELCSKFPKRFCAA